MSLWSESCFLAASWQSQHLSVKKKTKKNEKNNALEMAPDQTQLRLKTFMIRSNCARNRLWSDPSALESAYDQTFQTKITYDQTISRPWSDRSALELPKRPCNFGLGTHGCALDWVWSKVNLGLDLNLGRTLNRFSAAIYILNKNSLARSDDGCSRLKMHNGSSPLTDWEDSVIFEICILHHLVSLLIFDEDMYLFDSGVF